MEHQKKNKKKRFQEKRLLKKLETMVNMRL